MSITHPELVAALAKPGADLIAGLTPESAHLLHMAVGVAGEAGELLDAVKKHAVYVRPIDRENVVEELGDLEFYMEGIRAGLGITREEVLAANIAKLSKRYAGGTYSNAAAQARADKAEPAPTSAPVQLELPLTAHPTVVLPALKPLLVQNDTVWVANAMDPTKHDRKKFQPGYVKEVRAGDNYLVTLHHGVEGKKNHNIFYRDYLVERIGAIPSAQGDRIRCGEMLGTVVRMLGVDAATSQFKYSVQFDNIAEGTTLVVFEAEIDAVGAGVPAKTGAITPSVFTERDMVSGG